MKRLEPAGSERGCGWDSRAPGEARPSLMQPCGVENFPRFLEDWSGKTLTYNGSMVVMFPSEFATGLWRGTGSTIGIYNPPARDWAFDLNFRDINKMPPGTPQVRALIRSQWAVVRPNTTSVGQ
ncbi:MAG: hypothetical protein HZA90_18330 [Verrucomicrobia bacterium]|nr:hypothetical protein [Verrucomicrobiota bacterium]